MLLSSLNHCDIYLCLYVAVLPCEKLIKSWIKNTNKPSIVHLKLSIVLMINFLNKKEFVIIPTSMEPVIKLFSKNLPIFVLKYSSNIIFTHCAKIWEMAAGHLG